MENIAKMKQKHCLSISSSFLLSILISCQSIDIFKENSEIQISASYQSFVIINQEIGMQGFATPNMDEQVQIRIRRAMESAGMVYNKINPKLVIRYTSNEDVRERLNNNNFNNFPMWGYRIWDPWAFNPYNSMNRNQPRTSQYELLQVIIDFIDPKKDKSLMTLTGVTEIAGPKSKPRIVLKTTDKILGKFLQDLNFESIKKKNGKTI